MSGSFVSDSGYQWGNWSSWRVLSCLFTKSYNDCTFVEWIREEALYAIRAKLFKRGKVAVDVNMCQASE